MGVSAGGQRVHLEQRNGAALLRSATVTEEDLRGGYEQSVRQLLEALEARLLGLPPAQRFAALGALAAAVQSGRQVTFRVKPFTVRF